MKLTRIIAFAAFSLGGFGLIPQAHADWWWYHRHPRAVVVIGGPPVVVTRDYYGPAYYPYGPAYYPSSVAIDVQVALGRRGYYHGPADGVIGRGSRAAIRAYQADHHLGVTGRINRPLLHSLGR